MDTRREFIKKATLLSGMSGMNALIPASIQKALAIDPKPGTTWQDAEHIVILMQENRSFDHSFGKLKGVRGFNDPRAHQSSQWQSCLASIQSGRGNICALSSEYKRYKGNLDEFFAPFLGKPGKRAE